MNDHKPEKFCPFCGSANLKWVGGQDKVPRCVDCRTVFIVSYQRSVRKSPVKKEKSK